jgi:glycosyltransferase domain-containing protein
LKKILEKLTIVIPSYNKSKYLIRNLDYWNSKKDINPKIIVLDGSNQPLKKSYTDKLRGNIEYNYFKNENLSSRYSKVLGKLNTEYSIILNDDEFYLESGLIDCLIELEKNEIGACLGRTVLFDINKNSIDISLWKPPHTSYEKYEILDENPILRVLKHMNPYLATTTNAVTRTEIFKNNLKCITVGETSASSTDELAFEMISAYQSKSKVINTLMWFRSCENKYTINDINSRGYKKIDIRNWYHSNKFEHEINNYIKKITDIIIQFENSKDSIEISQIVKSGILEFINSANKYLDGIDSEDENIKKIISNNKNEILKNMITLKVKNKLIIFKDILIKKLNYKKLKYNSLNEFFNKSNFEIDNIKFNNEEIAKLQILLNSFQSNNL